jgi:hypothetical protein
VVVQLQKRKISAVQSHSNNPPLFLNLKFNQKTVESINCVCSETLILGTKKVLTKITMSFLHQLLVR